MKWQANHIYALLLGTGAKPDIGYLPSVGAPTRGPVAELRGRALPPAFDAAAKLARLQTLATLLEQPEVAAIMTDARQRLGSLGQVPDVYRLSAITKKPAGAAPCGLLIRKQAENAAGQYAGTRDFTLAHTEAGVRYTDGYGAREIMLDGATTANVMNGNIRLSMTPDVGDGAWHVTLSLPDSFDVNAWLSSVGDQPYAIFSNDKHAAQVDALAQLYGRSRIPHIQAAAALGALVYGLEAADG